MPGFPGDRRTRGRSGAGTSRSREMREMLPPERTGSGPCEVRHVRQKDATPRRAASGGDARPAPGSESGSPRREGGRRADARFARSHVRIVAQPCTGLARDQAAGRAGGMQAGSAARMPVAAAGAKRRDAETGQGRAAAALSDGKGKPRRAGYQTEPALCCTKTQLRTFAQSHVRTHARVPVGRPSRGTCRHGGQQACRQARPRQACRRVRRAVGDCGQQKTGRARRGTCQETGGWAGCQTYKTARGGQAGATADPVRIAHPHVRTFARAAAPEDRQSVAGRYPLGSRALADRAGRPSGNGSRRGRARHGSSGHVSESRGNQVMLADPSATIVTERHVPAGVTMLPTGRQREQDSVALPDAGAVQRMSLKGAEAPGLVDKPDDQQRTNAEALVAQPFAQSHIRTVARAPAKPTRCNATETRGNVARRASAAPERREPKDPATPPGGCGKPRRRGSQGGKVSVEEGECPGRGRCDGPAGRRRVLPAVGGHRPVSDTPGTVHRAHACRRHARMPIIARDERLCGDRDERLQGGAAAWEDAGRTTAAAATARTPPGNQVLSPIHFHQGDHQ